MEVGDATMQSFLIACIQVINEVILGLKTATTRCMQSRESAWRGRADAIVWYSIRL